MVWLRRWQSPGTSIGIEDKIGEQSGRAAPASPDLRRAVTCIKTCPSIHRTTDLRKYMIDRMLQQTSNFAPSRLKMQGLQPPQDPSCPPASPSCLLVIRIWPHCPAPGFNRRDDCIDGSRGLRARNSSAPRGQREGQCLSFACNAAHVPATLEYVLCAASASMLRPPRVRAPLPLVSNSLRTKGHVSSLKRDGAGDSLKRQGLKERGTGRAP